MAITIDFYLSLSIKDCRQMGFLAPDALQTGTINWLLNGEKTASITFATDTRKNIALMLYQYEGQPVKEAIKLMYQQSNLKGNRRGYYYFVCPVSGKRCRKLYLVNGKFVGRAAFRPLYQQQTQSRKQRNSTVSKRLELLIAVDRYQRQRYRRETYKGQQTPYGRKVSKLLDLMDKYFG